VIRLAALALVLAGCVTIWTTSPTSPVKFPANAVAFERHAAMRQTVLFTPVTAWRPSPW
jgi:hypothetical protein